MKRVDTILEALRALPEGKCVTASELAEKLGLARANVSNDLNKLCESHLAEKSGAKPVYYRAAAPGAARKDTLADFLKSNPSMLSCAEQAKAAIVYPPFGMHMFLFGDTGVGKSMFAELLFRFAQENGQLAPDARFVTFNCADYANNPQLLISQLFGCAKGAYTGAVSEREGLLEQAQGGVLFLDEVHRLPPEGQEMLFSFIDRGVFRRLGETQRERRVQARLICATTEDPSSTLLKTFLRRIPMAIRIPNLDERSVDERLSLISLFFSTEAVRLQRTIRVSVNSMRALMSYQCSGNIGQLKANIQILCAKAYSDFLQKRKDDVVISSYDLPSYIKDGLYTKKEHRQIWNRLSNVNQRFVAFDGSDTPVWLERDAEQSNIYQLLESRTERMKRLGASTDQVNESIEETLKQYYGKLKKADISGDTNDDIVRIVGGEITTTAEKIVNLAQRRLNRVFGRSIFYGIAIHLKSAIARVQQGSVIRNPKLKEIRTDKPILFAVATECLALVETDFNLRFPPDEAAFLALFFDGSEEVARPRDVGIYVIAHGASTASSMAQTANRLLGQRIAVGFDAPLEEKPEDIYRAVKQYALAEEHTAVLLLIDMGSLENFASDLAWELRIETRCISLVSTLHVLEAARKASLGYSLEYIYQETLKIGTQPSLLTQSQRWLEGSSNQMFILALCTTGEGSAALIRDMLSAELKFDPAHCHVTALQVVDKDMLSAHISTLQRLGKILCVVSSFQTGLKIAHYSIAEILNHSAVPKIQRLIDMEMLLLDAGSALGSTLSNIDCKMAFRDVCGFLHRLEEITDTALEDDMVVGIFCHLCCMLDRLKAGADVDPFPKRSAIEQKYPEILDKVREACRQLGAQYALEIPEDEAYYVTAFFMKEVLL